jgi:hypothetical protein
MGHPVFEDVGETRSIFDRRHFDNWVSREHDIPPSVILVACDSGTSDVDYWIKKLVRNTHGAPVIHIDFNKAAKSLFDPLNQAPHTIRLDKFAQHLPAFVDLATRLQTGADCTLKTGDLAVDRKTGKMMLSRHLIRLTKKKNSLMQLLSCNSDIFINKDSCMGFLYSGKEIPLDKIIDVYAVHIRKALDTALPGLSGVIVGKRSRCTAPSTEHGYMYSSGYVEAPKIAVGPYLFINGEQNITNLNGKEFDFTSLATIDLLHRASTRGLSTEEIGAGLWDAYGKKIPISDLAEKLTRLMHTLSKGMHAPKAQLLYDDERWVLINPYGPNRYERSRDVLNIAPFDPKKHRRTQEPAPR